VKIREIFSSNGLDSKIVKFSHWQDTFRSSERSGVYLATVGLVRGLRGRVTSSFMGHENTASVPKLAIGLSLATMSATDNPPFHRLTKRLTTYSARLVHQIQIDQQ
jgi:hypothetical protein